MGDERLTVKDIGDARWSVSVIWFGTYGNGGVVDFVENAGGFRDPFGPFVFDVVCFAAAATFVVVADGFVFFVDGDGGGGVVLFQ